MIHLQSITARASLGKQGSEFPFNVPMVANLEKLTFETPVTFLVGENGSGKSTFLEALAVATRLPTVGAQESGQDQSLGKMRELSRHLQLAWSRRTHRGFFLRAEDFFGFAKRIARMRTELEGNLAQVEAEYGDRSVLAKAYASMPYARELGELRNRYGDGLDAQSHGESFLTLFQSRFVPDGFYLLDEPEAPLSPLRQIGFLTLLQEMVNRDAQFVIATHSPILMAFPGATILDFDQTPPRPVAWSDLEHVSLTRDFLNDPQLFLHNL